MNSLKTRTVIVSKCFYKRFAANVTTSAPAAASPAAKPQSSTKIVSSGSTFLQRLTSFLAGLGLGLGTTSYFILSELKESNEKFSLQINNITERVDKVEKNQQK